jgi:hypothetical protein
MLNIDTPMYRTADGNVVQFWEKAVQNKVASAAAGRPIFYKALMARITSPSMKTQTPDQQIRLTDENGQVIRRTIRYTNADSGQIEYWEDHFREQLKAFEQGRSDTGGTPLDSYPKLDVAQIAMLRLQGITCLEMLAGVADSQLASLGTGARSMRDGAKAYIEAAKGNAPVEKLTQENEQMRAQIAAMQENMNNLLAMQAEKRKPGRPRSADTQAA